MARYATFEELRQRSRLIDVEKAYRDASRSAAGKTLFLSHATADIDSVGGVMEILQSHGASVYVDASDTRLPEDPSPKTAEILKDAIRTCRRFVLFLTPTSAESVWIPWELGLADGTHGPENIALFPASNSPGMDWAEREYLGLYRRILWGRIKGGPEEWLVYDRFNDERRPLRGWINLWDGVLW